MEALTRTIEEMLIFFSFLPFGGVLIIFFLGYVFLFLGSYLLLTLKSIESLLGFICWLIATSSIVAIVYDCHWIRKQPLGYPLSYQVLGYLVLIVLFFIYFFPVAIILDEKNFRRIFLQRNNREKKEQQEEKPPDWYKAWKKRREFWIARNKILQDKGIRGWIEHENKRCEEWDRMRCEEWDRMRKRKNPI